MRLIILLTAFILSLAAYAQPNMDASLYFGPSIDQFGNIADLGKPEVNSGFEFNYYITENHGIGFAFSNEYSFESKKFPKVTDASIQTFDIHYSYRRRFHDNWRFTFTPGVGTQTLYNASRDYYWGYWYYDSLSTAWVLDYKLMFDYNLKTWESSTQTTNMFLGAGVMQVFSFNDDYAGKDISGSRLAGVFRWGFEF